MFYSKRGCRVPAAFAWHYCKSLCLTKTLRHLVGSDTCRLFGRRVDGWKPKGAWRICYCGSGELAFCIKREDWKNVRVCVHFSSPQCILYSVMSPSKSLCIRLCGMSYYKHKNMLHYWSPWVTLTKKKWINRQTAWKTRTGMRQGCLNGFHSLCCLTYKIPFKCCHLNNIVRICIVSYQPLFLCPWCWTDFS